MKSKFSLVGIDMKEGNDSGMEFVICGFERHQFFTLMPCLEYGEKAVMLYENQGKEYGLSVKLVLTFCMCSMRNAWFSLSRLSGGA